MTLVVSTLQQNISAASSQLEAGDSRKCVATTQAILQTLGLFCVF